MLHRTLRSLMVATVATASLGAFAGATATADTEHQSTWKNEYVRMPSDGDDGGVSIYEKAKKPETGEGVSAEFRALGEVLWIYDGFDNGRPAIAKLWVGGSGPAVFYGNGDGKTTELNLSYAEGQTVHVQVCTSDSPNAVCTAKTKEPGRT